MDSCRLLVTCESGSDTVALYTYKFCLRIVDRVQTYVLQPTNAKILNPFQEQNIYRTGDITGKYAELKSNRTQDGETREID